MINLEKLLPATLRIILVTIGFVGFTACSQNGFTGGGATRDGIGLQDGGGDAGGNDAGADANDGGNSGKGGLDANDGGGGSGSGGGKDGKGGIDGNDGNGGDGIGGSDSGGSGKDGDDDDDDDDDDDSTDDDGEVTKKTRSDMHIQMTRADDPHIVKVELLIKGKVSKTKEFIPSPLPIVLKDMCRRKLDTCVKVTFIGKLTQKAGAASCVFVKEQDATTQKIDVDTNGAGFIGTCKPDEDETYFFKCPDSKSLKVQNCNG